MLPAQPEFFYRGTLAKIVDGDTIDINIDLGFRVSIKVRVRLARIDTPELNSPDRLMRDRAIESREFLVRLGMNEVRVHSLSIDKYGRSIAEVFLPDGRNLSDLLLEAGLAQKYI